MLATANIISTAAVVSWLSLFIPASAFSQTNWDRHIIRPPTNTLKKDTPTRCQEAWDAAREIGLVRSATWPKDGGPAVVMVDDTLWKKTDFTTKQGLLKAAQCHFDEANAVPCKFEFRSHRTNNVLAETPDCSMFGFDRDKLEVR